MNHYYQLPSFNIGSSDLYSGTLDIINQSRELNAGKQQQVYPDLYAHALKSHFPVYNSQSYMHQDETGILKSLHEYNIASLADFNAENSFETGLPEIPKSALDKYVPWNSNDEAINNGISSISDYPSAQQVCLSDSVPDPIPFRHLNPDNQLAHLHALPFNQQDLPPVTFVNSTNLNQTTIDKQTIPLKETPDSFLFEQQGEQTQDSEKRKMINQRKRERYREMMKDPEKRKLINQRKREQYREMMKDPEKRKLKNQRQNERMKDPEKRKLENQRKRELRKDPEIKNRINQRQRELYNEKMKDPEKRKILKQRKRERRQDPEKRKLKKLRQRGRRQDLEKRNPV
ncbi:hypothetical protein J7438_22815 [Thalassotalea sp. G20_0]|uniref:hypothetical protein n=1 Tax=Thalassotalea sp. G20_0 TaxID=2821093 RepID=UPI001ADB7521|nr:hypothetical protein [Thalassotalea sp. G20_0]MBO9496896.1 hypothetical protein [Thalassotalea sp. G20_0]